MLSITSNSLKSTCADFIGSLLFKEFLLFSFSTVVLQASRFLVALVAAKQLGPTTWGIWQLLLLILTYGSFIHLGTINGMNREIPIFKGKMDIKKIDTIREVTFGAVLTGSIIAGLVIYAIALTTDAEGIFMPLKWMPPLLAAYMLYMYLQVYLKSDKLFSHVSMQQFFLAIAFPAIVVPLLFAFQLVGYIIGYFIALFITCLIVLKMGPVRLKLRFDTTETMQLLKIGFPIMIAGILYALMMTIDRLVISTFLTIPQLGYYSLSIMVIGFLVMITTVVGQQIYPRMAESWGRTSNHFELIKWMRIQLIMSVSFTLPLILATYFLCPIFVKAHMSAYVPGITAMKISLISPVFLAIANSYTNFLNTINKQFYVLLIQGAAIIINILLNIILIKMGLGIKGVAVATAFTYFFYCLMVKLTSHACFSKKPNLIQTTE